MRENHCQQFDITVTAHIVCGAGSMKQGLLSVCLSQHGRTAANQLLQVCCCGPSNRLLQQRTNAGSATLSVYVGS